MAVSFVQKSAQLFINSATSIAPSLSGVTAGNLVVLVVGSSSGVNANPIPALAPPTGWTAVETPVSPAGTDAYRPVLGIFCKLSSTGGTESATVALPTDTYAQATIIEFACSSTWAIGAHTHTTLVGNGFTSGNTGSVTNAAANAVAIVVGHPDNSIDGTSGLSSPASTGYTVIDTCDTNANHIACDFSFKILTSTGSQSAGWTWTGNSYFNGAIALFEEEGGATDTPVNPDAAALTLAGHAPTIDRTAHQAVAPAAGALALTGYAPSIARTANQGVAPGAGSLALAGHAPTIGQPIGVAPGAEAVVLTGFGPVLAQTANRAFVPAVGALTVTGLSPTLQQTASGVLVPGPAALTVTGAAPALAQSANRAVSPGAAGVSIAGLAPTVAQPHGVAPAAGPVSIAGLVPNVAQSASHAVSPGTASMAVTGLQPTLSQSANRVLNPGTGGIVVTGAAPSISQGAVRPSLPGDVWDVAARPTVWPVDPRPPEIKVTARPTRWLVQRR